MWPVMSEAEFDRRLAAELEESARRYAEDMSRHLIDGVLKTFDKLLEEMSTMNRERRERREDAARYERRMDAARRRRP